MKTNISESNIAETLNFIFKHGKSGLHIILYVDDQVLFQIIPAHHYVSKGIAESDSHGFIEIHFFNKNKTLTIANEQQVKEYAHEGRFIYFEEPKGIHNYIRAIGVNPVDIEQVIYDRINTIYSNIEKQRIYIDYVKY